MIKDNQYVFVYIYPTRFVVGTLRGKRCGMVFCGRIGTFGMWDVVGLNIPPQNFARAPFLAIVETSCVFG